MKPADDPILEYIRDAGEVNPAVIARNIDVHRKYVSKRCRAMTEHEVLESLGEGYYRLTGLGERYLKEELEKEELEMEDAD